MFCYQCQETAGCKGCTVMGVCGKKPEVAAMQDLLIYVTKGLSAVTTALRAAGKNVDRNVNHLVTVNLFTTITNANFDREAIIDRIKDTLKVKADLLAQLGDTADLPEAALWNGAEAEFDAKAKTVGVLATENEDVLVRELITYGLKRSVCLQQTCQTYWPRTTKKWMLSSNALWLLPWMIPNPWTTWLPDSGNREIRRTGHGSAGQSQHHGLRQP